MKEREVKPRLSPQPKPEVQSQRDSIDISIDKMGQEMIEFQKKMGTDPTFRRKIKARRF